MKWKKSAFYWKHDRNGLKRNSILILESFPCWNRDGGSCCRLLFLFLCCGNEKILKADDYFLNLKHQIFLWYSDLQVDTLPTSSTPRQGGLVFDLHLTLSPSHVSIGRFYKNWNASGNQWDASDEYPLNGYLELGLYHNRGFPQTGRGESKIRS